MNTSGKTLRTTTAFGIAENGETLLVVKATRRGRSLSFTRAAPSEIANSLSAACLFQRESFTRWLTAPIASSRKAETVFHSLLDIQLPFPVEDCEVSLLGTQPTPDHAGTRGLIAGARTADIEKRIASLAAAGLDPVILDQEGVALWFHGLEDVPPAHGEPIPRVLVYLAEDRITLALGQGAEFLGAHTMREAEAESVHRHLKSIFKITPPVTQWIWTGPGAVSIEAVKSLHATLADRWPGRMSLVKEPELFLARALAARALTGSKKNRCNLRTGRFTHPLLARENARRPYRLALACLAAGLLLCAMNVAWMVAAQYRTDKAQKTLKALAIDITGSPVGIQQGQEALTARRAVDAATKDMEPFLAAIESPLHGTLANLLTIAHEEGITIETMTLNRKTGVIHGLAPKWIQGEKVAQRLNASGWTATIERKDSQPSDERIAFVIGISRK